MTPFLSKQIFAKTLLWFFTELSFYCSLFFKIYKVLCYTRITFDQLPLFNPYSWPLSFIRIVTRPYFNFWGHLLPSIRIETISLDVASLFAMEALNTLSNNSYAIHLTVAKYLDIFLKKYLL